MDFPSSYSMLGLLGEVLGTQDSTPLGKPAEGSNTPRCPGRIRHHRAVVHPEWLSHVEPCCSVAYHPKPGSDPSIPTFNPGGLSHVLVLQGSYQLKAGATCSRSRSKIVRWLLLRHDSRVFPDLEVCLLFLTLYFLALPFSRPKSAALSQLDLYNYFN